MEALFGSSGVRGKTDTVVTPELALKVGQALATYTKGNSVLVAQDTRTTSGMLQCAITAGIMSCGTTVMTHDVLPTPALAYLTKHVMADAGVMITASHNPPEYNGLKLFNPDTAAYNQTQQEQIERIVHRKEVGLAGWRKIGQVVAVEETDQYLAMIMEKVNLQKPWKVVLDLGNGATCTLAPLIFKALGCRVTTINSQPDGYFPGRGPEPAGRALKIMGDLVLTLRADIGIAYDGDGDRMVTTDEKGRITPLDQLFASYAGFAVQKEKNKTIITNVEASMSVEEVVERRSGRVVRAKVGDVSISEALKKSGSSFGGEPCGAWIHPKYHYCPDGILSSILLLQALEETGQSLSGFVSKTPRYPILRKTVECSNLSKQAIRKTMLENLPEAFAEIKQRSDADGLRLTFRGGWLLVRPSGTEPLIRVTVEAESSKIAQRIMNKALRLVNKLVKEANQ
ncbi:MAG: phosphoglucosamine mutase [Candidatus Bathyarchaeota archaeon]|nr:phosphoglucosamine mutase [Candidatus Bathyarchaeota archaeon]